MILIGNEGIAANLLNNTGAVLMKTGGAGVEPEVFEIIDKRLSLDDLENMIFKYGIQACLVKGLTGFEYDRSLELGLNIYFAEEGTVEENVQKFVDDMLAFEGTVSSCSTGGSCGGCTGCN